MCAERRPRLDILCSTLRRVCLGFKRCIARTLTSYVTSRSRIRGRRIAVPTCVQEQSLVLLFTCIDLPPFGRQHVCTRTYVRQPSEERCEIRGMKRAWKCANGIRMSMRYSTTLQLFTLSRWKVAQWLRGMKHISFFILLRKNSYNRYVCVFARVKREDASVCLKTILRRV